MVVTSLMSNLSDKILKTNLCKENQKGLFHKIFPTYKALEQIGKKILIKKIPPRNKAVATGIYWAGSFLFSAAMSTIVYKIRNAMIRRDVKNYVANQNSNLKTNYEIPEVFKQFIAKKV